MGPHPSKKVAPKYAKIAPKPGSQASKSIQNPRSCGHGFLVRKRSGMSLYSVFSCSTPRTTLPGPFPERVSRFSDTVFVNLRFKIRIPRKKCRQKRRKLLQNRVAKLRNRSKIRDHAATVFWSENVLECYRSRFSLVLRWELLFLDLFPKAFGDFRIDYFFIFDRRWLTSVVLPPKPSRIRDAWMLVRKERLSIKNTFYGCFGARAHTFELLSPCKLLLASCFQKGKTHIR